MVVRYGVTTTKRYPQIDQRLQLEQDYLALRQGLIRERQAAIELLHQEQEERKLHFMKTYEEQQNVVFKECVQEMRQYLQETYQETTHHSAAALQEIRLTMEAACLNNETTIKGLTATITQLQSMLTQK